MDFTGWVILLGGLSGMQSSCGGSDANFLLSGGSAGYNAPVSCDTFFSYAWWIAFYNIAVWIVTAVTLAGNLPRFRPGIIALLAISIMQSMETANNYLYYDTLPTSSGAFVARAIIKSVALLLLVALIGARDERVTVFEPPAPGAGKRGKKRGAEALPPLGPPPSVSVLEPEPLGVRPGRIAPPSTPPGAGGQRVTASTVSPV